MAVVSTAGRRDSAQVSVGVLCRGMDVEVVLVQ